MDFGQVHYGVDNTTNVCHENNVQPDDTTAPNEQVNTVPQVDIQYQCMLTLQVIPYLQINGQQDIVQASDTGSEIQNQPIKMDVNVARQQHHSELSHGQQDIIGSDH